ncbi:MAG: lysine--tRNA ligase [Chloroflexi bacterium]|nr:lysine--tRNA ligase [Chloroflexota bacterium]
MTQRGDELIQNRRANLVRLIERGVDPYPPRFTRTHTTKAATLRFERAEARNPNVAPKATLAGRITRLRDMGRASFVDILDGDGSIQIFLQRNVLNGQYELIKELDLGDFIGVKGTLMRTKSGEISLAARELTVLAKAVRPPPEKWHGLQDQEKRYRQRYLDLMSNRDVLEIMRMRSRIISGIRRFFDRHGFLEVDTPVLVPIPAGAMAQPFETHHNALDRTLYLRIATELYLKRLIVGGIDKVYELGRVFRNEGIDQDHNPEFTLLESYEAYADYTTVMTMVEEMVSSVALAAVGSITTTFDGNEIDFTPPWPRLSLLEAIKTHSGIDINDYPDAESLAERLRKSDVPVTYGESRGRLIDKLVSTYVEPGLIQPTFLIDYPVEMSPLAKAKSDAPHLTERFEAFAGGMEIANSFTELNDPAVQRQRLEEQEELRKRYQGEDLDRMDEDFLVALEHGMPPTGGLGMGIDRLVMLLTGQRSIRDVVLFPQIRNIL